jgi:UDP-N-acetylmuramoyl-L-alanyl-D-glutamate--2,6-diaminopimelate ligase
MPRDFEDLAARIGDYKGLASDSRKVKKGYVFVAVKGLSSDGHDYIAHAIKNGATVVVGEKDIKVAGVDYVRVPDSREALGVLASKWFKNPSEKLKVIGVTGTKGKTTTCYLIYHILKTLGKKVGLVTSISAKIGEKNADTGFHVTSPDVITLHKMLSEMVEVGCEYAVVEVSSHGIDQKRIAGVKFDIAALTNIAPEHLDYHKTFREYKRVKMSFVNSAKHKVVAPKSTDLDVLPGGFNNLDAEAAIDTVRLFGINRSLALSTLKSFKLPEGRMEEIKNNLGIGIFIDFAHTPESLSAALGYLRTKTKGNLISVFGCAGERDPRKRSKMGKISSQMADLSVFTAEDPRNEDIFAILTAMRRNARNYVSIPERGEAIAFALSKARAGDTIGIFGKGHEKSMAYKGFEHPWSDKEVVQSLLKSENDVSAIVLAGGKGTRMKSREPKVLKEICGRPMIAYTLENLRKVGIVDIALVVSFRKNMVIRRVEGAVKFAYQKNPKGGTADAAKAGFGVVSGESKSLLVINGDDSAFYTPETIRKIMEIHKQRERKLTFVSLIKEDPTGLGRVIRGKDGLITKIVEEKGATEEERKIKEVNDGLYVFDKKWFSENINKVKKSAQGEYYLVDLVKIAIDRGDRMATYTLPNDDEWQGVNNPEQLEEANKKMARRLD